MSRDGSRGLLLAVGRCELDDAEEREKI